MQRQLISSAKERGYKGFHERFFRFVVRKKVRTITTVIKVFLEMHEIMTRLYTMSLVKCLLGDCNVKEYVEDQRVMLRG